MVLGFWAIFLITGLIAFFNFNGFFDRHCLMTNLFDLGADHDQFNDRTAVGN
jgi:hypothetical protein